MTRGELALPVPRVRTTSDDLLVNNAGVVAIPQRELDEDGFERQFGTNYPWSVRAHQPLATTLATSAIAKNHDRRKR